MKIDRIPCEVPFCKRTADSSKFEEGERIVCRKHWRLGDARPRRVYSAAMRKFKKTGDLRYVEIANRNWERVRKQAIERAGGL